MYGLLLAVVDKDPALSAALLNRLAITVVEVALFGVGVWLTLRAKNATRDTAADRP